MSRWQIGLLAAAALLLAALKIYDKGEAAGLAQAEAQYAEQLRKAEAETQSKQEAIDAFALKQLAADQQRQITHREIIRESQKIIDRPIYRNRCVDADGLRLLDDIAANAHAHDPTASDDRPAAATETATRH